jgi:Cof subfamily protein (haloacid dehalogenase superfamily)
MKYKVLVIDLDGTLLNSDRRVSEKICKALIDANNLGIKIIVATARPPRAVQWLLPQELQAICSYIYYNGAMIQCDKSGYYDHTPINTGLSAQVIDYCLQQDPDAVISVEIEDRWISSTHFDDSVVQAVRGKPEIMTWEEIKKLSPSKIIISGIKNIEPLIKIFDSRLKILLTDRGELIQISNLEATKEAAVMKLCKVYKIDRNEVVAFGDDTNDLGLFQWCGWTVAMDNAIQELKEIASEVTKSNDDDGVAVVIERLIF